MLDRTASHDNDRGPPAACCSRRALLRGSTCFSFPAIRDMSGGSLGGSSNSSRPTCPQLRSNAHAYLVLTPTLSSYRAISSLSIHYTFIVHLNPTNTFLSRLFAIFFNKTRLFLKFNCEVWYFYISFRHEQSSLLRMNYGLHSMEWSFLVTYFGFVILVGNKAIFFICYCSASSTDDRGRYVPDFT